MIAAFLARSDCCPHGIKLVRADGCFRSTHANRLLSHRWPDSKHERRTVMKLRQLIPAILATAAAFGASASSHAADLDAQAQASALLSRPNVAGPVKAHEGQYAVSSSADVDAHASAAALLSGRTSDANAKASARFAASTIAPARLDAHAHAASLLRGSRTTVEERSRSTHRSEPLSEHPAVLVAQTWSTRGIDPSTFIVGHPAGLQLLAASPTESESQGTESVPGARVAVVAR